MTKTGPLVSTADAAAVDRLLDVFEREGSPKPPDAIERYLVEQSAGMRILLIATLEELPAGYLTLSWEADHPPFRRTHTPEIQDLDVLPSRRRRGVATALLSAAERLAASRAREIGLNVGLYSQYGPAQRLYAGRGYLPDGRGATSGGVTLFGGEVVRVDDSLVMHLTKRLDA